MRQRIHDRLRPVVRRQRGVLLLRGAALGLLAASAAGVALGLAKWITGRPIAPSISLGIFTLGPILGLLVAALRFGGWRQAAASVDAHHRLKDRTVTALSFLRGAKNSELHQLQVADAEAHLETIEPHAIVPIKMPRVLPYAFALLALSVGLLAWPLASKSVRASITPAPEHIVLEAEKIEEDLKNLDALAKKEEDPALKELVKDLRKKAEEMKQPGVDTKEALAKLSEMQAAVAAQQAQFNLGLVDGQLQSLGDAMVPAQSLEAAGKALQEGKYEQAAKTLETLENPELDRKEAKAVEEKMSQAAKQMGDVGLGEMGEAASEMAEGLKDGQKGKFGKGAKGIAKMAKSQGKRKKIFEVLAKELEKLSECKSNCQNTARVRLKTKTNSPSQSAGLGISGNIDGEKSKLASRRDVKETTGQPGDDGPSEVETTHSAEGRQTAARGYRESYQKYRKMSEAVLDSEPIPLGHRQTIRRYFELIRPQAGDEQPKEEAVKEAPAAQ